MLQFQKQSQPICAMLNKSIYCCCMVSAWTYFLLASLLFPPWILENIFNILYIMQVLAKTLGILWCTKNEKIVKNQHKNLTLKSILFCIVVYFWLYCRIHWKVKKTRLLKLLIFLSTTNSFHQIIEKEPQNNDIIFVEKSK